MTAFKARNRIIIKMIKSESINPFVPGYGIAPETFPGREAAQTTLKRQIRRLKTKSPIPGETIISAPRGNGKTALLNRLEKEITENYKKEIDIIQITPNQITSPDALLNLIKPETILEKIKRTKMLKASMSIQIPDTPVNITPAPEWHTTEKTDNFIEKTRARCKTKPLILTIDEAHTLNKEAGHGLLNASQKISNQTPFLLILAGTPDIEGKLNAMNTTFWTRSEHIKPDLLSKTDSAIALTEPFKKFNITFEQKTLASIVEDAKGYPHFIQAWGNELFEIAREKHSTIINKTIQQQVQPKINMEKTNHYNTYSERLEQTGLTNLALEFGEILKSASDHITGQQTLNYIKRKENVSSPEKAMAIRDELRDIGYIWPSTFIDKAEPPDWNWSLAIPSLVNHIKQQHSKTNTEIPDRNNSFER